MSRTLIVTTFLLLFIHQHISNSTIGLNHSKFSVVVFLLFLAFLFFQLLVLMKPSNYKMVLVNVTVVSIVLWLLNSDYFKDLSFLILNVLLAFYVTKNVDLINHYQQLKILVLFSFLIGIIQISGTLEIVHIWNSQFIQDFSGIYFRNIELQNLYYLETSDLFDFDSRQVRAPGLFHSSALVSGIYVLYIAIVFVRLREISQLNLVPLPFIAVFSGSKLVLALLFLFLIIATLFNRIGIKGIIISLFSLLASFYLHKLLFPNLFNFQFNLDILFYSIDLRLVQFALDSDLLIINFLKIVGLTGTISFLLYLLKSRITLIKKIDWFNLILLFISLIFYYITTPHIANLLFGWFFFSSIILHFKKSIY